MKMQFQVERSLPAKQFQNQRNYSATGEDRKSGKTDVSVSASITHRKRWLAKSHGISELKT